VAERQVRAAVPAVDLRELVTTKAAQTDTRFA
jgi:hypothetical protein